MIKEIIIKMKRSTLIETITVLYIILFFYTGISKIIDFYIFREQIATSPILSHISEPIAIAVPTFEFLTIFLLAIPKWRLKGLWACLILMSLFTIYILSLITFSDKLPCSCGGIIEVMSWNQHVIFNSVFIILSIVGILFEKRRKVEQRKEMNLINDYKIEINKALV